MKNYLNPEVIIKLHIELASHAEQSQAAIENVIQSKNTYIHRNSIFNC